MLEEVLRRCAAIPGIDAVCCAVPEGTEQMEIAAEVLRVGAIVTRGSESDVLDRYFQAARLADADIVMRVTSDCPLIDPILCGEVLALVRDGVDYACNNLPPLVSAWTGLRGLYLESLRKGLELGDPARGSGTRHAVSPAGTGLPARRVINGPGGAWAHRRWTLDHPQDYEMLKRTFALLPPAPTIPGWREVAAILDGHPEIEKINREQHQR